MIKGKIFLIIFASLLLIALPIKILADTGFISWDMSGNTGNAKLTIDGDMSEIVVHIRGERGTSKITAYAYLEYYNEADDRWIADTSWSEQTESAQLGFTRRTAVASGRTYRIRVLYYVYDKNGKSNSYTIYGNEVKSAAVGGTQDANGTQGTDAAQNTDGTQGVNGTQGTGRQDVDEMQGTDAAQNTGGTQGANGGTQAGTQKGGTTASETQPTTEEATQEETSQEETSQEETTSASDNRLSGYYGLAKIPPEERVYCFYGLTEIPDIPGKDIQKNSPYVKSEGKLGYADFENPAVYDVCPNSMVFETHTFGEYTLRLVGDRVRTDKENYPGWIYAGRLYVEVQKNGVHIGDAGLSAYAVAIADGPTEYRIYEDYIGNYVSLYDLWRPVIAVRYIFGYEPDRNLKKMVTFAIITDDGLDTGFLLRCAKGTCVTMWQGQTESGYDGYYSCVLDSEEVGGSTGTVYESDEFVVVDDKTLMDNEGGIKYTFDFSESEPPFYQPIVYRCYVEKIQTEINWKEAEFEEVWKYIKNGGSGEVWSADEYDGWKLVWTSIPGCLHDVLLSAQKDGVTAEYEYNDEGIRISKTVNGVRTVYEYGIFNQSLNYDRVTGQYELTGGERHLVKEIRDDGREIEYVYDYFTDITNKSRFQLAGFVYEGIRYDYEYDTYFTDGYTYSGHIIKGILCEGEKVAEYEYYGDEWINTYLYADGVRTEVGTMEECLPNIVPFRLAQGYHDNETGWRTGGSRYYNPRESRYVDGISPEQAEEMGKSGKYPEIELTLKTYTFGAHIIENNNE